MEDNSVVFIKIMNAFMSDQITPFLAFKLYFPCPYPWTYIYGIIYI